MNFYLWQIGKVRKVLEYARVPLRWYSFGEEENRICITVEPDGIHVFVRERSERSSEQVCSDWYSAIKAIAPQLEYQYTKKVEIAAEILHRREPAKEINGFTRSAQEAVTPKKVHKWRRKARIAVGSTEKVVAGHGKMKRKKRF